MIFITEINLYPRYILLEPGIRVENLKRVSKIVIVKTRNFVILIFKITTLINWLVILIVIYTHITEIKIIDSRSYFY